MFLKDRLGRLLFIIAINTPWSSPLIRLSWKIRGLEFGRDSAEIVKDYKLEFKYKLIK